MQQIFRIYSQKKLLVSRYWNFSRIALLFFWYSLGENKLVKSTKLLPLSIKLINPIKKVSTHHLITWLYSVNHSCDIFFECESFNFFGNIFNLKTIKVCYITTILIQSYKMSSYWFLLIHISYVCAILYFR